MPRIALALLVTPLLLLVACSTPNLQHVPFPDLESDLEAGEVGRVFVLRQEQTVGSIRSLRVYDGGVLIGSIGKDGFLCWDRPAGRNPLAVVYEGPKIDGGDIESISDLHVVAGAEHYYEVSLDGGTKKPVITKLEVADGRARIQSRERPEVD